MRKNLTDLTIRSLPSGTYFDTKTPAFGIRIGKHRKTWFVVRTKARLQTVVGRYPDLPLSEARTAAKRLLTETPERTVRITFETAKTLFIAENYTDSAARTRSEAQRLLDKHFASIMALPLSEVTDRRIQAQLDKLKHTPSELLHAFRVCRTFLRWCTRPPRRYIPHSPLEGYEAPGKDKKRTRILTDDELRAVWNACSGPHGAMTRLIILWGTRKGETLRLRREWVVDDLLTIPGSHTKNGRAHAIPLLPLARSILDAQPYISPYFFPGRLDKTTHSHEGAWDERHRELLKASQTSGWTAHDLRRTFRSNLARLKVPRDIAERLLNHAPATLDDIYDQHSYLPEKREALAKIEAQIISLLARA